MEDLDLLQSNRVSCKKCRGTGIVPLPSTRECPLCKGRGYFDVTRSKAQRRKDRNDKFRDEAVRQQRHFTDAEIAVILDTSLSTAKIAKILRRSIKSIETKRYTLRGLMNEKTTTNTSNDPG